MEYWNTEITEKSWELLQKIKGDIDFVLIGGWAAYLWAKSHKSKDIDIVINFNELNKLKSKYNLTKNDNLRKYQVKIDDIDIDIYVPFYSKLPLITNLKNNISQIEGFNVVRPEVLIVLKQAAEIDRSSSEKGLKDRIDLMDLLLNCDIDFKYYNDLIKKDEPKKFKTHLIGLITKFRETKYLNLTPRELKIEKEKLLKKLRNSK